MPAGRALVDAKYWRWRWRAETVEDLLPTRERVTAFVADEALRVTKFQQVAKFQQAASSQTTWRCANT